MLNTYVQWHPQVLHDLHESVPYLYDNTVGDGPYNAWIDPILADEWQMIGWNNVSEMTKFGMPGVFTHGNFDTWSPGYLMFIAALHNGISRLYETFGNGGADTVERTLQPERVRAHLVQAESAAAEDEVVAAEQQQLRADRAAHVAALLRRQRQLFLRNFYLKSKRSILKAKTEGPAAYVFPGDDPRPGAQAELLRVLQKQGVEISRATAPFTVMVPGKEDPAAPTTTTQRADGDWTSGGRRRRQQGRRAKASSANRPTPTAARSRPAPTSSAWTSRTAASPTRCSTISTGARTIRSARRTTTPGWTFPELFNVQASRVTRRRRCSTRPMEKVKRRGRRAKGGVAAIRDASTSSTTTPTSRWRRCATAQGREVRRRRGAVRAGGHKFNRGSFIIRNVAAADVQKAAADLGLQIVAIGRRRR